MSGQRPVDNASDHVPLTSPIEACFDRARPQTCGQPGRFWPCAIHLRFQLFIKEFLPREEMDGFIAPCGLISPVTI